jgi:N-acetylneuraminate synthase
MDTYDFRNLFILDLANNHQGDMGHGLQIIKSLGRVAKKADANVAIKFQFRHLETFIHPNHLQGSTAKHIPRFLETRLGNNEYIELLSLVREMNMTTMCTPFDEKSVDLITDLGIELIKVASCSVSDIPLLLEIAQTGKPVVISTGGASSSEIDKAVQVFLDKNICIAIEHCVAIYPTPPKSLQLNQIDYLIDRYPNVPIGWSTHEDPDDLATVQMAIAKGAQLFERHVGLATDKYNLNAYSSSPDQIASWIYSAQDAIDRCGSQNRAPSSIVEQESLNTLRRGVFANREIEKGEIVTSNDVFFAIPIPEGGLSITEWSEGGIAQQRISKAEPIPLDLPIHKTFSTDKLLSDILRQMRSMLNEGKIQISQSSTIELSHHYGLDRFREFGAIIVDVVNRSYCKKLIIQLPRQKHPYHYHKQKEETFQVLYGDFVVEKDGTPTHLTAGDLFLVEPGCWHKFSTMHGVIFEEISTTHYNDDSYYQDPVIARQPRTKRKTILSQSLL